MNNEWTATATQLYNFQTFLASSSDFVLKQAVRANFSHTWLFVSFYINFLDNKNGGERERASGIEEGANKCNILTFYFFIVILCQQQLEKKTHWETTSSFQIWTRKRRNQTFFTETKNIRAVYCNYHDHFLLLTVLDEKKNQKIKIVKTSNILYIRYDLVCCNSALSKFNHKEQFIVTIMLPQSKERLRGVHVSLGGLNWIPNFLYSRKEEL